MLHVADVNYLDDYRLWLRFDNGATGTVDLEQELWGEIFSPLHDKTIFASVRLDQELGTIVWANGADFAPEFLLTRLRQEAVA